MQQGFFKTMENVFTPEENIILLASRLQLNAVEKDTLNSLVAGVENWQPFAERLKGLSTLGLMYKNFITLPQRELIPKGMLSTLKKRYTKIFFDNALRYRNLQPVIRVLNEHSIPFIPLKGIVLAERLYKDVGLRGMCDMDILVKPQDVERTRELVLGLGWKDKAKAEKSAYMTETLDHQHPYAFVLDSSTIELHKDLHSQLDTYKINVNECWERAIPIQFNGGTAYSFCVEDMLIHLCTHLCRHLIRKGYNFKHFCDIAELLRTYEDKINWQQLAECSKKYNSFYEVRDVIAVCGDYLKAPVNMVYFSGTTTTTANEIDYKFLFVTYFKNDKIAADRYIDARHNINLFYTSKVSGWNHKLRYFLADLFPSRDFMMSRYKIKNRTMVYLYYPVRLGVGVGRLLKLI